jgi:hypothetical protein
MRNREKGVSERRHMGLQDQDQQDLTLHPHPLAMMNITGFNGGIDAPQSMSSVLLVGLKSLASCLLYCRERLIMSPAAFRAMHLMRAENFTPNLPLKSRRTSANEKCQENIPHSAPWEPHVALFHARFMRAAARVVTAGSRRRSPCRWIFFVAMRAASAGPRES